MNKRLLLLSVSITGYLLLPFAGITYSQAVWTQRIPQKQMTVTTKLNSIVCTGSQLAVVGDKGSIYTSTDGANWTQRASGTNNSLNSIIWTGTLLVAVGWGGTILTSPDGIVWTSRSLRTPIPLTSVSFSGRMYVAVGDSGTVCTSTDAVAWTNQKSGFNEGLNSVYYHNNQFIAAGRDKRIISSTDGAVWSSCSTTYLIAHSSITVIDSQWIAVGEKLLLVSTDGKIWTLGRAFSNELTTYQSILSVAANGNTIVLTGATGAIITSTDGVAWKYRESGTKEHLRSVIWTGTQFYAVGDNGIIISSPDGITWTTLNSATPYAFISTGWTGEQLFAATRDSLFTSTDGVVWTAHTLGIDTTYSSKSNFRFVTWAGNKFWASGETSNGWDNYVSSIFSSSDGTSWTLQTSINNWQCLSLIEANGKIIAVGSSVSHKEEICCFLSSESGGNLVRNNLDELCSGSNSSRYMEAMTWTGDRIVAVGWGHVSYDETSEAYVSLDGVSWTRNRLPFKNRLQSVAFNGTRLAAVGPAGPSATILTSLDGTTWTKAAVQADVDFNSIIWSGNQFVVAGNGGRIYTSGDGLTWTNRPTGTKANLYRAACSQNMLVAAGEVLLTSPIEPGAAVRHSTNMAYTATSPHIAIKQLTDGHVSAILTGFPPNQTAMLQIFNCAGKRLVQTTTGGKGHSLINLPVQSLPAGIYILHVTTNKFDDASPFVIGKH